MNRQSIQKKTKICLAASVQELSVSTMQAWMVQGSGLTQTHTHTRVRENTHQLCEQSYASVQDNMCQTLRRL